MSYLNQDDDSSIRIDASGGPTFRFFPKTNLGVAIHIGAILRRAEDQRDVGVLGAGAVNYYQRIGSGWFLAPRGFARISVRQA